MNDLWMYNQTTGRWTWLSGSNAGSQSGSYGTLGTAAPGNVPGARRGHTTVIDSARRAIYLFGGTSVGGKP